MSFSNTNASGISFAGITPMIPIPGSNTSPNTQGIPNNANYFFCGGNEQTVATTRTSTIDAGSILGAASGTTNAQLDPMQGSSKYFIHGSPATRLNDASMTNNHNAVSTQTCPSHTKGTCGG